jgi:hypothetical protein
MTKDLALACGNKEREAWVTTSQMLQAIEKRFKKNLDHEGLGQVTTAGEKGQTSDSPLELETPA